MSESRPHSPAATPRKRRWKWLLLLLPLLGGSFVGSGTYTFMYANGGSYLSNDPAACANCHVMSDHLSAWEKSPHHAVATCNDCHAPHDSIVAKYFVKGVNGWNHSLAFTTGNFKDELQITDFNRKVTESACRYCHGDLAHSIEMTQPQSESVSCLRCHSDVGHLE